MFERAPYEVRGATEYDQRWIDGNIEAGVGACNWPRPQPRPPELDAAPAAKAPPPKPRRGLVQRIKERVGLVPAAPAAPEPAAPAAPEPAAPAAPELPPPAVTPPPPPDPLDELLGPK